MPAVHYQRSHIVLAGETHVVYRQSYHHRPDGTVVPTDQVITYCHMYGIPEHGPLPNTPTCADCNARVSEIS